MAGACGELPAWLRWGLAPGAQHDHGEAGSRRSLVPCAGGHPLNRCLEAQCPKCTLRSSRLYVKSMVFILTLFAILPPTKGIVLFTYND